MVEMQFNFVSASEAGDYFQVLFEEEKDNDEKGYFLMQRQFEFPDEDEFYLESDDNRFCGHFQIAAASLSRDEFCLELLPSTERKKLRIRFYTDPDVFEEVKRVLRIMFEDKILHLNQVRPEDYYV